MNKGFTMVETLAALVILSVIMVFVIPAVQGIATSVRSQNLSAKVKTIESSTLTFANEYLLDEIKCASTGDCLNSSLRSNCANGISTTTNCCRQYDLYNFIVANGIYSAENTIDGLSHITNPFTHERLTGCVRVRFNFSNYQAEAQFIQGCTWPAGMNTNTTNGSHTCQNAWRTTNEYWLN